MDCKNIIVWTDKLTGEYLREFFNRKSNANKFIDFSCSINYSKIKQNEWAFKYFTQKCINKEFTIYLDQYILDAKVLYETLFGNLKMFKNMHIDGLMRINGNVCLANADTHTQSLSTNYLDLAVLALNNCRGLTKLEIGETMSFYEYQELIIEKLSLQELVISDFYEEFHFLSDIFKKSKDTLCSLTCRDTVDLSPLRDSTQLRILRIRLLKNISYGNFEIIRTFSNLEELQTGDQKLISLFKESQALKTIIYDYARRGRGYEKLFDCFPQSVTTLSVNNRVTFDQVKEFLEENPFVKELTIKLSTHEAAALLNLFKHVKFNFTIDHPSLFRFSQCYSYLHPQCKQIVIPGSEPDHVLYERLFERIDDKRMLLEPYLQVTGKWNYESMELIETIPNAPPEFMKYLATFNEFKNCLRIDNLDSHYFERVFNYQMSTYDDEYLRIIVTAYDEVFQLQADIHNTVTILMGMTWEQRSTLKRERFFHHCRNNWIEPLTQDFLVSEESEEYEEPEEY
ncbi:hypothetical protein FGO68_gene16800 [Halteria grandinella]|uniref:Uncharacterized protein n=1 Tax=Halteria grandinella TaxID=5974 RepID=A0A8J8P083_HALGN|nr:hypothetical protein FGO68_gene16800 [Halteria grandinella]